MVRTLSVPLVAIGLGLSTLLAPATSLAASTGAVTGTITCGAAEDVAAVNALVGVPGTNATVRTDGTGAFSLSGLPAGQSLTVQVSSDAGRSTVATRANVVVQAGQTLDVGSMDLSICPQPVLQRVDLPVDDASASFVLEETPKGAS